MSGREKKAFGGPLYEKLRAYGESDFYAFHMPGHKRLLGAFENPFGIDISEIDGFDDLHHPETDGVLTRAQERAARLYGAEETHFLINGSTAGILSAVSGCSSRGGRILMARNCHRSVYHGAELRDLETVYLYPQQIEELGINGAILPEDVEKTLAAEAMGEVEAGRKIQAVLITSPTYDGVCSDVRAIAKICHRYGKPLIVDQAHGAHFAFSEYFPEDALTAGADVVIHSLHKTLPALTQTALLHIQGDLADRRRIREYLSIYQSSSPSYVLMASIDACIDLLEREREALFAEHTRLLAEFRESCRDLGMLVLAGGFSGKEKPLGSRGAAADFDRSKLLISARRAGLTGGELLELLLRRYHIQMEMAGADYVVGIAGVADRKEGFERLRGALHELDRELREKGTAKAREGKKGEAVFSLPCLTAELTLGRSREMETEPCGLSSCGGRLAGTYLYLYPPGIPLAAPGERLTEECARQIEQWLAAGFTVHGLEGAEPGEEIRLPVLKEEGREAD